MRDLRRGLVADVNSCEFVAALEDVGLLVLVVMNAIDHHSHPVDALSNLREERTQKG